jgi:hypothetical protein
MEPSASRRQPGSAGDPTRGARTPGGAEASEEVSTAPRDRHSEGKRGQAARSPTLSPSPGRRPPGRPEPSHGEIHPWRGRKPRGGTSRRGATCAERGNGLPRREKPGRRARNRAAACGRSRSSVRQAGWSDREVKDRAAGGESSGGHNPTSVTRLKEGGRGTGGTRRQEGEKPWRRSVTGRGKPGAVASRRFMR